MQPLVKSISTSHTPESLAFQLRAEPRLVCLRTGSFVSPQARYSFVASRPFLTLRAFGPRCEICAGSRSWTRFGDPWQLAEELLLRFESLDQPDLPFPLGGCFGFWGYGLRGFIEPKLRPAAHKDLGIPDCDLGFYSSLVIFDHWLGRTWLVCTGLDADGTRSLERANHEMGFWFRYLENQSRTPLVPDSGPQAVLVPADHETTTRSNFSRPAFTTAVKKAQEYIRAGDIYQVNLAQQFVADWPHGGWRLFERLLAVSPAPFSAYLNCGDFELASSSPELFLKISGCHIETHPIKGTRPRSPEPTRDAQLAYELQTSAKEMAELVMITDLLRNDLGRICEFGSIQVPEIARLERFSHVQHLVSTIEGRLRPGTTHLAALASCFPGGSITGAPKFRAMEIIDELEPAARGPYTGALGYLGFNRESQLSIIIRAALCRQRAAYFHAGAGIVAGSSPEAEYQETLAKARGFFGALAQTDEPSPVFCPTPPPAV